MIVSKFTLLLRLASLDSITARPRTLRPAPRLRRASEVLLASGLWWSWTPLAWKIKSIRIELYSKWPIKGLWYTIIVFDSLRKNRKVKSERLKLFSLHKDLILDQFFKKKRLQKFERKRRRKVFLIPWWNLYYPYFQGNINQHLKGGKITWKKIACSVCLQKCVTG